MLERAIAPNRFTLRTFPLPRSFADDVRDGLRKPQKELQPWYFYDSVGSALFAAICELPEYTITRAEAEIFRNNAPAIARAFASPERVVELGSGDGRKTRLLLEEMLARQSRLTYAPIDVDGHLLESTARDLLGSFHNLQIDAVCADYREITSLITSGPRTVVFFLGSSIGNLDPAGAASMLRQVRSVLSSGDSLFLGADLQKPKEVVERAYNDSLGVTAAFNLNLLARINRELGGHFDLSRFAHLAFLNQQHSRIEMHLVSRQHQRVAIDALEMDVDFAQGETIHTENSYKYAAADLENLAAAAGFSIEQRWHDASGGFADVLMIAQ